MKTKWMLLAAGSASGIALAAALAHSADLPPMAIDHITGNLHIVQAIPCDTLTTDTPVTQGRIGITPAEGIDVRGGKSFLLTGFTISFAPFSMSGSCFGFRGSRTYSLLSVQLGKAVAFTAADAGDGVFDVRIPKADFLIFQAAVVDGNSERGYKHPSQDVTGTIDLAKGIVTMRVVAATSIHFEEGCALGKCTINEDDPGTLTVNLAGTIVFPDADGDGVADRFDNCRFMPNPDQSPVATPTIAAPAGLTLASCADRHIGVAKATDVCDGGPVIVTNNAPGTFVTGSNLVTWTAHDARLRTATSTQTVTVVDTTPPTFTFIAPDITLNDCKGTRLGTPTATDDCAGTVTFRNNAPDKFFVGATAVTWTARDAAHNRATATQMVTVHDRVPPAVVCSPAEDPNDDDHGHGHGDNDHHDNDHDHGDVDDGFFRVFAHDSCGGTTITLGTFTLAEGEVIKIEPSKKPGIKFLGEQGRKHVKAFQVGPGQNVIAGTDGSGNVQKASCDVPRGHDKDEHRER
jgi:hypothetical protein